MGHILAKINAPNDIKKVPPSSYGALAQEIREFLINHVSRTGGHLASNLGIVEITMALHLCLTLPEVKIIFDVGHQSYVHKILTGRKDRFDTLRKKDGLCGFPRRSESPCDCFGVGHSSTSISAALGFATARDLAGGSETIVALIGDGALSGGMAFEALNNLARIRERRTNLIILLNDNKMSIAENVGGMSAYLSDLRSRKSYRTFKENVENTLTNIGPVGQNVARTLKRSKDSIKQLFIPGMLFENMGVKYYGPVNGHDIKALIRAIETAKSFDGPILIHAITKKGKGYKIAERNPERFHGLGPFDVHTGDCLPGAGRKSYTQVFSEMMLYFGQNRDDVVAITAAMPSGTGLTPFKEKYPDRFFDVGIAEEHAVTFAAGLAAAGMKPVLAIYSTFLQRAYDQILHDVCLQNLPVFFCIDRSGLVGADGETHQGVFDISYLSNIPNLTLMAPKNEGEMKEMMNFAMNYNGPIAMKYPRGSVSIGFENVGEPLCYGKSEVIVRGEETVILSVGSIMEECYAAKEILKDRGICVGLVNARFIKPLDKDLLRELAARYSTIVTVEENVRIGGYGSLVSSFLHEEGLSCRLVTLGIGDSFVRHATVAQQRREAGIDCDSIVSVIERLRETHP